MKKILLAIIRFYRKHITVYTPPSCRFRPTCSEYAEEAVSRYGAIKGTFLSVKRICRCNPWYRGDAYDPVPMLDRRVKNPSKEENK